MSVNPTLKEHVHQMMEFIRNNYPHWLPYVEPIKWTLNSRLKRTLGMAYYGRNEVEMNEDFVNTATPEAVYDTVTHEAAHFIAMRHYNCHAHGRHWKSVHSLLGGNSKSRATKDDCIGYEPKRNRMKRIIISRNGEEFKVSLRKWNAYKPRFIASGYQFVRMVIDNT